MCLVYSATFFFPLRLFSFWVQETRAKPSRKWVWICSAAVPAILFSCQSLCTENNSLSSPHVPFHMVSESQSTTSFIQQTHFKHQLGSALASRDVTVDGIEIPAQAEPQIHTHDSAEPVTIQCQGGSVGELRGGAPGPAWRHQKGFPEEGTPQLGFK